MAGYWAAVVRAVGVIGVGIWQATHLRLCCSWPANLPTFPPSCHRRLDFSFTGKDSPFYRLTAEQKAWLAAVGGIDEVEAALHASAAAAAAAAAAGSVGYTKRGVATYAPNICANSTVYNLPPVSDAPTAELVHDCGWRGGGP